jgi:GNAT superfamily N-acetyltransferase
MEITVRPARPGDIPRMSDLLDELFSLESDFEPDLEKQVKGLSMLVTDPAGTSLVLVALIQGQVIGMATVQTLVSTAEGGRVGLVEDVIVDRDFRGSGIGTRLLDHVLTWCEARRISRVQLLADRENSLSLSFYASRGWSGTSLICLRKRL